MKNKKRIIVYVIILSLIYYVLNLNFNFKIPCLIHEITNLYCPGCGITRMFFSIIRLDFYQAFRFNPLVFTLLVLYIIVKCYGFIRNKDIKLNKFSMYFILVITLLFGILRNISIFEFLKPTIIH